MIIFYKLSKIVISIIIIASIAGCIHKNDNFLLKETDPIKIRNGTNNIVIIYFKIWDVNNIILLNSSKKLYPNDTYTIEYNHDYRYISLEDNNNRTFVKHEIGLDRFYVVLENKIQLVIIPI